MLLRAGQPRRDTYSAYTQDLYPAELILHPEYNLHTVENDIALIRLNNSIRFNDHVRPVCLPKTSEKLPVGRRCTVIGWGKQGDNGRFVIDVVVSLELSSALLENPTH